jgi:hypothetical protein
MNIFQIVLDKGDFMCVMYLSHWKYLGSLDILLSLTMIKEFNGHAFGPHGIITSFFVEPGEKSLL